MALRVNATAGAVSCDAHLASALGWILDFETTTDLASELRLGTSHLKSNVAARAPAIWAAMKPGTSLGLIPANVSLKDRAIVTAGFANEVDAVNQYAAVMYNPTAKGTIPAREREQPQMTDNRPKVATNSLNN